MSWAVGVAALFIVAIATPHRAHATAEGGAAAPPAEVRDGLPGARLLGNGRLTYFGLHIYDARLWSANEAVSADFAAAPLALELAYARSLEGRQIAERSLEEMRRSGDIAVHQADRWLAEMKQLFPDVVRGDRITGVLTAGGTARFFVNGMLRGEVRDPEFARRFFGIWLSPATSEPKLRAALLGPPRSAP